jgi:hypothetical protein
VHNLLADKKEKVKISKLFGPLIRDGEKSGSGMNVTDHFSESLEIVSFWVTNT